MSNLVEHKVLGNPQDQVEPEYVDCLKTGKKREGDVLADPAFVLLGLPVQFERTHRPEFCQGCPEDAEIDVMSQVDPHAGEEREVWSDDYRVEVVERF